MLIDDYPLAAEKSREIHAALKAGGALGDDDFLQIRPKDIRSAASLVPKAYRSENYLVGISEQLRCAGADHTFLSNVHHSVVEFLDR